MGINEDKYQAAIQLQNEGKHIEAVRAADNIPDPVYRACILIDSGKHSRNLKVVRDGVKTFENLLSSGWNKHSRASLLYNIANGCISIYELRLRKGTKVIAPNDDDLLRGKWAYREALAETKGNPPRLRAQIQVNYGNCLSMLGRSIDAIQAYNASLAIDSINGMAAGNLGIELNRVAQIMGRYTHHYILAAHHALTQACSPKMNLSYGGPEAKRDFTNALSHLQDRIDAHKGGLPPLKSISISKEKRAKHHYIQFCLKNHLFLNAWVGNPNVTPSISDEIAFGPINTQHPDDGTVPELLRILNEVKEAFTTARYLLYLAYSNNVDLDDISTITSYFDYTSEDLHGLYVGLCKSAYMRSFDVLDKVARIVNVYFKIGKRTDYFWHLFAEKQSRGEEHEMRFVARPAIINTRNSSLYALADVCIDYFESERVDFKTIDTRRNRMTHDYLAVSHGEPPSPDGSTIAIDELYRQTLTVLQLAKLAILYAVSAVHIEERQKTGGIHHISLHYDQVSGHKANEFPKPQIM